MKKMAFLLLISLVVVLASGCGAAEPEAQTPTATAVLPTTNPTDTPQPTATSAPTSTPVPTETSQPTLTAIPAGSEIISQENIAQVKLLDWFSYGDVLNTFYIQDGEDILGYAIRTFTHIVGFSLEGDQLYELPAPQFDFFSSGFDLPVNISANHRYLCMPAEASYSVDVFDLADGQKVSTLNHLENFPQAEFQQNPYDDSNVLSILYNQNGSLLALAYADTTISIWNVESGKEYSLPRTFEYVFSMDFSPDSKYLAITASIDGNLTLFDISSLENIELVLEQSNVGQLIDEPFSPGNKYLLTMERYFSQAPKYALFDLSSMEMLRRAALPGNGTPMFSTDERYLIFQAFLEPTVPYILVDLETGQTIDDPELLASVLPAEEEQIIQSDDMKFDETQYFPAMRLTQYENSVRAWNQFSRAVDETTREIAIEYWEDGNTGEVFTVPVTVGEDGTVPLVVYKFDQSEEDVFYCSGEQLLQKAIGTSTAPAVLAENCYDLGVVAYDPVNDLVAYSIDSRSVAIIDLGTGEQKFRLSGYNKNLGRLRFSADGDWVVLVAEPPSDVYSTSEMMLFRLNHETGEAQATPLDISNPVLEDYILDIGLAGDGSCLVAGIDTADVNLMSKIQVWDFLGVGAKVRSIPFNWPTEIALSPDSQMIATAYDNTLYFLSVANSELLGEVNIPVNAGTSQILFSADGKSIYVLMARAIAVLGVP